MEYRTGARLERATTKAAALSTLLIAAAISLLTAASASAGVKRALLGKTASPNACAANDTIARACLLTGKVRTVHGTLVKRDQVEYYKLKLPKNVLLSVRLTLRSRKSCLRDSSAVQRCGSIYAALENAKHELRDASRFVQIQPDGVVPTGTMTWDTGTFPNDDPSGIYYLRIKGTADHFGKHYLATHFTFTVRECSDAS